MTGADFRDRVLGWGRANLLDRPWRRTRDPWSILVAEVMAQQTQIARVEERWQPFLDLFPDARACAARSSGDVVRAWQGLGYNRRAVALHRIARRLVADFGGAVPRDLHDLLELPGIGPYTARALRAFAFEEPAAVVDTNVGRLLARVTGRRLTMGDAQALADEWADGAPVWLWNQTVMEIGARVCAKRAPSCGSCPIAVDCAWRGAGEDPACGSAAVTAPQARFDGSDRQVRGRIVTALSNGPVDRPALLAAVDHTGDPARIDRLLAALRADGLIAGTAAGYRLP